MGLTQAEERLLRAGAEALAAPLEPGQLAALGSYVDLLEIWNRRTNLLATKDRAQILERHVLDSLACLSRVRGEQPRRIADVGSGGGLPGVPLAAGCPGAEVVLVEPRRKKASFLRAVARECSTWNIRVEERRAAEVTDAGGFDVVTTRAAFAPKDTPNEAGHLVRQDGLLLSFATEATLPGELAPEGFEAPVAEPYRLGDETGQLVLVTWRRSRS